MNREIKFRAWDGKEMRFSFLVARPQFADALSVMHNEDFAKDKYKVKEWKLMQYTGLKDKNGKEIYEGDILKFRSHPEKMKIGNVYYEPNWGRFLIKSQDEFEKSKSTFSVKSFGSLNHKEVIGNIFQNPVLLQ